MPTARRGAARDAQHAGRHAAGDRSVGDRRVTTAPAAITASRPTSAITTAALPIQLPAPMRTGVLRGG